MGAVAVGLAVVEVIAGLLPTYPAYASSLFVVGILLLVFLNSTNTIMQLMADPWIRGRVMALYLASCFAGVAIGGLLVGLLAQLSGPRIGLLAGGGVTLLATLIANALLADPPDRPGSYVPAGTAIDNLEGQLDVEAG